MDLKTVFGMVLREQRKQAKFSQEELALKTDLDRTYISKLERGLNQPSLETIFVIAKVLECSPTTLIEEVEKKANRT